MQPSRELLRDGDSLAGAGGPDAQHVVVVQDLVAQDGGAPYII